MDLQQVPLSFRQCIIHIFELRYWFVLCVVHHVLHSEPYITASDHTQDTYTKKQQPEETVLNFCAQFEVKQKL